MADQTSPVSAQERAATLPTFGEGKEAAGGLAEEAATARSPLGTRNLSTFGEGKEAAGGPAEEV